MAVVWSFLFCSVDLPPPEGREELREWLPRLNERFRLLAHVALRLDVIDLEVVYK